MVGNPNQNSDSSPFLSGIEADEIISRSDDSLKPDPEPEYDPEEESKDVFEPGRKRKKI